MSNVHVKISNVDVILVVVQSWSGAPVKSLNPGESAWFAVSEGSAVSVQADPDAAKMVVSLEYVGPGSPVSMSTTPITLDLYSSPVYVQAATSMALKLQAVYSSSRAGNQESSVESASDGPDGVKCGEIIIYPPA